MASAVVVLSGFGLNRTIWRFCARPDYIRIIAASLALVIGAVLATFVYNRLEGVPRSLPVLQFIMCLALLIGARVLHKISHDTRHARKTPAAIFRLADEKPPSTVLIVGISKLIGAYLQAIAELAPGRIRIAGLVGQTDRHVGRLVATYPVLGVPEDIASILDRLEVHGVVVDRIIIASSFHSLAPSERQALLQIAHSRAIPLQLLAENLGFEDHQQQAGVVNAQYDQSVSLSFEIGSSELGIISGRRYWSLKRAVDCLGALALLVFCSPLFGIAALLVVTSAGWPLFFWQQRPGLGGRPFRVYKFRTMRSSHASDGRKLSDEERLSLAGTFMRRVRLDELPQLFNIVRGDMSFIGPRPLLPCDQSDKYRARLLVRPGLTGWAQVVGGRHISPGEKAALDVWYVRSACLALDLEIVARTVAMLLFGERISRPLIERAWRDLSEGGVLKGEFCDKVEYGL